MQRHGVVAEVAQSPGAGGRAREAAGIEHPHLTAGAGLSDQPERVATQAVTVGQRHGTDAGRRDDGLDHVAALDQHVPARGGSRRMRRHEAGDGEGLGIVHDSVRASRNRRSTPILVVALAGQPSL